MSLIDQPDGQLVSDDGIILSSTVIKDQMIPCPVNTSMALYIMILCILSFIWINYRFLTTYGINDIKSIGVGVVRNISRQNSNETIDEQIQYNNSSEEFPIRKKEINIKPLLRLFILLCCNLSLILLILHLLSSFHQSYLKCKLRYSWIFPYLEDSFNPHPSINRNNHIDSLLLIYSKDVMMQNILYASSMLFDFSRAFLITALILFIFDFPASIYRRLPANLFKTFLLSWSTWLSKLGYIYAPLSILAMILIRILAYNSHSLYSVLISQYFLDAEFMSICLIMLFCCFYFLKRKFRKENANLPITVRQYSNSNSTIYYNSLMQPLISKENIINYILETLIVLIIFCLLHSISNVLFYYNLSQLNNNNIYSPWVLSLLNWFQYFSLPWINILIILSIYPREDLHLKSQLYMESMKPILDSNLRSNSNQNQLVSETVTYIPPPNNLLLQQHQDPISEKSSLQSINNNNNNNNYNNNNLGKIPVKMDHQKSDISAVVPLKEAEDSTPQLNPILNNKRQLDHEQTDTSTDTTNINGQKILAESDYYLADYQETSVSEISKDNDGDTIQYKQSKDSGYNENEIQGEANIPIYHLSQELIANSDYTSESERSFLNKSTGLLPISNKELNQTPPSINVISEQESLQEINQMLSEMERGTSTSTLQASFYIRDSLDKGKRVGQLEGIQDEEEEEIMEQNNIENKIEEINTENMQEVGEDIATTTNTNTNTNTPMIEKNIINQIDQEETKKERVKSYIEQVQRATKLMSTGADMGTTTSTSFISSLDSSSTIDSNLPKLNTKFSPILSENGSSLLSPNQPRPTSMFNNTNLRPNHKRLSLGLSPRPMGNYESSPNNSPSISNHYQGSPSTFASKKTNTPPFQSPMVLNLPNDSPRTEYSLKTTTPYVTPKMSGLGNNQTASRSANNLLLPKSPLVERSASEQ
ncbi:hypothetical protein K502DRAFT_344079 [Neoconidiobolus thromboides FSU 785]|nr:hypothetical protein K502DRAFT_344079 [Neoconidiobolus thromboides FSU 785]